MEKSCLLIEPKTMSMCMSKDYCLGYNAAARLANEEFAKGYEKVIEASWVYDDMALEYDHHKCSHCDMQAPYDPIMREDWDEGLDGEWYSLGMIQDGITEHLYPRCPYCGAKMRESKKKKWKSKIHMK